MQDIPVAETDRQIYEEISRKNRMLDSLPAEQAETVRLKCYDNLTFRQIAELTEISEATVNSRCRYANTYSETIRIEEEIWMLNIKPKSTQPIWAFKMIKKYITFTAIHD